jgi:predicted DNA-binding transcriptional regulator AlpA
MLKDELTDKYGATMTIADLAEVFQVTKGCLYNKISQGTFEVPMVRLGGRLVALTGDVVDYIDAAKKLASSHA